jgi:hypothetical protein
MAVDERDVAALVRLYVPDVAVPDGRTGRAALAQWYDAALRASRVTFHLIGNHLIEMIDEDRARGTLYCRAEHEVGDRWIVMPQLFEDDYRRHGADWLIERRRARAFYAADVLTHPNAVPGRFDFPASPEIGVAELPEIWPSWQRFWNDAGT